jgi:hypothetical protein
MRLTGARDGASGADKLVALEREQVSTNGIVCDIERSGEVIHCLWRFTQKKHDPATGARKETIIKT